MKVAFWIDTIMIKISYAAIPTSPYVPYGSERHRGFFDFFFIFSLIVSLVSMYTKIA